MRATPFLEHPVRFPRLAGFLLRLLTLSVVAAVYHHFTFQGMLNDTQWGALNIDGIELGKPRSSIQANGDYLRFDGDHKVRYVSGRELRLQGRVLLEVGDEMTAAREILGSPHIVEESDGAVYYYYHRGPLTVACARGQRERISQIALHKSEKKKLKHQ